jgi:hypothetical protein
MKRIDLVGYSGCAVADLGGYHAQLKQHACHGRRKLGHQPPGTIFSAENSVCVSGGGRLQQAEPAVEPANT